MTRSFLFALLIIATVGETGLAIDEPTGVDFRSDFEILRLKANSLGAGAIEFGPVTDTTDVANPFEPVASASETSSQQDDRVARDAYRAVQEWLRGDGYALGTDGPEEYWHENNGCEAPPIAIMRTPQFDAPLLAPITIRNERGVEITLVPGMKPSELIKLIQPLPGCIPKLLRFEKSLVESAGTQRLLILNGESVDLGPYSGSGAGVNIRVGNTVFVTSKLFPHHLFNLHFKGSPDRELTRVEIVDGSCLMWLRRAHGERFPVKSLYTEMTSTDIACFTVLNLPSFPAP